MAIRFCAWYRDQSYALDYLGQLATKVMEEAIWLALKPLNDWRMLRVIQAFKRQALRKGEQPCNGKSGLILLTVLMAIVMAACSSDGEKTTTTSGTTDGQAATDAPQEIVVRVNDDPDF